MKIAPTALATAVLLPNPSQTQVKAKATTRLDGAKRALKNKMSAGYFESSSLSMQMGDSRQSQKPKTEAGKPRSASSAKAGKPRSASSAKAGKPRSASIDGKAEKIPVLDLFEPGQPLKTPKQIEGREGGVQVTLRMGVAQYNAPSYNVRTRVYNGDIPGPTIRIKPGDKLQIRLINDLKYPLGNLVGNEWRLPNTTNIHTHGLHVSPKSPGDSIYVMVEPGEEYLYKYEIDTNHMPGTFWYHPHMHGSTSIQNYNAIGLLIIDDPHDYPIPRQIKEMPEVQIILMEINPFDLYLRYPGIPQAPGSQESLAEVSDDLLTLSSFELTNRTTSELYYFVVNGQYQPVVSMEKNKWSRFRMLNAAVDKSIVMMIENLSGCEMGLIAKDGIYLNQAPRSVHTIILSSANRADLAIRCVDSGTFKMVMVAAGGQDFDPDLPPPDLGGLAGGELPAYKCTEYQNTGDNSNCPEVFTLKVKDEGTNPFESKLKDEGTNPEVALEPFSVPYRPCYLADLLNVTPDYVDQEVHLMFPQYFPSNLESGKCPYPNIMAVNGVAFTMNEDSGYIYNYSLGSVIDMYTFPNGVHPYHQHINPFQLTELPVDGVPGSVAVSEAAQIWYQVGDWHDTIGYTRMLYNNTWNLGTPEDKCMLGEGAPNGLFAPGGSFDASNFRRTRFRWAADQFTGDMILHCHRLIHEDTGMMGLYELYGTEGQVWEGARDVDPNCVLPGERAPPLSSE